MAPRGGRSGGFRSGGGGRSIQCAFDSSTDIAFFVNSVIFFVFFALLLLIAFRFRKNCGSGKRLIGAPYLVALLFNMLGFLLNLIATALHECGTGGLDTYYGLLVACFIFLNLGYWLLIFVYIYVLNMMLRERLGGSRVVCRVACIAIVAILFSIFCAVIGVQSYDISASSNMDLVSIYHTEYQLTTAFNVLVLLGTLASGGLSFFTLFSLRSRQHPASGVTVWIGTLLVCTIMISILSIVLSASLLNVNPYTGIGLSITTQIAIAYLQNLFALFSFVILLFIAKHAGWNNSAATPFAPYVPAIHDQLPELAAPPQQQQQQNAYNQPGIPLTYYQQQQQDIYKQSTFPQAYYQQQAPVYDDGLVHVK